eukprot:2413826-Prymnesium_polylepis.2
MGWRRRSPASSTTRSRSPTCASAPRTSPASLQVAFAHPAANRREAPVGADNSGGRAGTARVMHAHGPDNGGRARRAHQEQGAQDDGRVGALAGQGRGTAAGGARGRVCRPRVGDGDAAGAATVAARRRARGGAVSRVKEWLVNVNIFAFC